MAASACFILTLLCVLVLYARVDVSKGQGPEFACDKPRNAQLPFCDSSLPIDVRVQSLMDSLTLGEKIGLLNHVTRGASQTVDLDEYNWWSEALHGVADSPGVHFRPPTEHSTVFPQIINLAASFRKELFFQVGNATGNEARAFFNVGNAGLTFWSPNINIYRDPRWGRGHETPGEDPHLNKEFARAFVKGLQGEAGTEARSGFLKTSACCKHFVAHSLEEGRDDFNSIVTEQDMADTYLPAFKSCVQESKVSCVMCAYNAVNGVPACADKALLTDVVRRRWGFDGYIVSDCGAVGNIMRLHNYTQNETETCHAVLEAGLDIECSGEAMLVNFIPQAIAEGLVTEEMVDEAASRGLRVLMRLGYFEKEATRPYKELVPSMVDSAPHQALALEAARQSIVLLKNAPNAAAAGSKAGRSPIPIDAAEFRSPGGAKRASMAVIGPFGYGGQAFLANYHGIPSFIKEPVDEIRKHIPDAEFEQGCNATTFEYARLQEAEDLARASEQVVLFVGINMDIEQETRDRPNLTLPGLQNELIRRVLDVAQKPVIMFVVSGGGIDVSDWKDDPRVGAIIWAGYLGQSAGEAMADVMFGVYNPSGRLPQTFYSNEFINQVAPQNMYMRPVDGSPGRTYRFYTGQPVYEFGYGLSYTTFDYSLPSQDRDEDAEVIQITATADECAIALELTVRNSGQRAGDHSVLWFIAPPGAGQGGRPIKSLLNFDRVNNVQPEESRQMTICLNRDDFQLANEQGEFHVVPGEWKLMIGSLERTVLVV